MSLKKDIISAEVQLGSNEAQKSLVDLSQKTAELTNKNDMLRKSMVGLKAIGKEQSDEYKALSKEVRDNTKEINANQGQMDALRKTLGLTEMSQKQLRQRSSELRKELNGMSESADPARFAKLNTELIATEKQFNKNKSAIGTTSSFMGKLGSSLTSIPGPVGAVIQSIDGMGKALWTLVANPIGATIAVIVGALMLLYKAFTSTDSGANTMAGAFKTVSNVLDVLIDRTMSFFKMLGSLLTFDWEGFKKNGADTFIGIGKQIKDTANAGYDYVQIMDDIADREAAAQTRMSKLRAEIEKLKNESKDANKTAKEKSDLIDQAMAKEIELFGIEKGFMKERTAAEVTTLASKINNNKLTMAQKEELLKQWLEIDDKQLASAMEKDAAFAEFENKNEEAFQKLQKMKAEEFDKDAEFEKETRRLQKSASTEKQAIIAEEIKARKDASDKAIEILDTANNERNAKLISQYETDGWTDAKFQSEQLAAEQAYLILKRAILEEHGQSVVDVDNQINQKRIEAQNEFNAAMSDSMKELSAKQDEEQKNEDDALSELIARTNKALASLKTAKDKEDDILKQRAKSYTEFAQTAGETFAQLMLDNEASMADYLKATILLALEALHEWLKIEEAKMMISGIEKGIPGIALAVAKIAAMELAYNVVKGILTKKGIQSGGFSNTDGSDSEPDGIYHKNEFIGSGPSVRNPTIKPIYDIINLAQQTGTIATLNLPAVMAATGMLPTGRQSGGYGSGSASSSSLPPSPVSGFPSLDSATANRLAAAIELFTKKKLVVYTEDIRKSIDRLEEIDANSGL